MIWIAGIIFLCIICFFLCKFLYVKIQKIKDNKIWQYNAAPFKEQREEDPCVSGSYSCSDGVFIVTGNRSAFTVKKNQQIEFLVTNGKIVGFRNVQNTDKYTYYGGTTK